MLPHIEYLLPETLEEACRLLAEAGDGGVVMAGGTDLLVKMKAGGVVPRLVVALGRVPGLDRIAFSEQGDVSIGATTRLADVAGNERIAYELPAVAEAAADTATPQIRNMGTVVGNLCNAAPSADNAPCLLALEGSVSIQGPSSLRELPLAEFFKGPGLTALSCGEIVTRVVVPKVGRASGLSYRSLSARGRVDIAAAGAAALVELADGVCCKVRVVLGGVAPVPLPVPEAAQVLEGTEPAADRIVAAAARAAAACTPISDVRASAEYRRHVVEVLTRRALAQALERAQANAGRAS